MNNSESLSFTLSHSDTAALSSLCGQYNEHLKLIEKRLNVIISNRATDFQVTGDSTLVAKVAELLKQLYAQACEGLQLDLEQVHLCLQQSGIEQDPLANDGIADGICVIKTRQVLVKPRGPNQQKYVPFRSLYILVINGWERLSTHMSLKSLLSTTSPQKPCSSDFVFNNILQKNRIWIFIY